MTHSWIPDERTRAGEEHLDPGAVAEYPEKAPFDPSREIERLRDRGLEDTDTLVDFGAGTGQFLVAAAEHCGRAVAVDVSPAMVRAARERIEEAGVQNAEVVEAGVLRYEHEGCPAEFAFSRNALHHLPDFWKGEALKTVARTLEPGGIFRLRDLVYDFDPWESERAIEDWLDGMAETPFPSEALHRHVREEYSTYGTVMEQLIETVGFEIESATYRDGFYAGYTCRWPGPRESQ